MICLAVFKALAHGRCSQSCHQASAALTLMLMGMEARCYPGHWDGTRAKGINSDHVLALTNGLLNYRRPPGMEMRSCVGWGWGSSARAPS